MRKEQTIRGFLIPIDWNEDNSVTEVALKASDGKIYVVGQNGKGNELLTLFFHNIEASEFVGADEYSDTVINVYRYVVL